LSFDFTKAHPFTSQTYDFPPLLNKSNPQISCLKDSTIFQAISFSAGFKITGYQISLPFSFL